MFPLKLSNEHPLHVVQDGLFLLSQEPELIKGYEKAILTPNYVELQRLHKAVLKEEVSNVEPIENVVSRLADKLGNVTLVLKGEHDIISNGRDGEYCVHVHMWMCSTMVLRTKCEDRLVWYTEILHVVFTKKIALANL